MKHEYFFSLPKKPNSNRIRDVVQSFGEIRYLEFVHIPYNRAKVIWPTSIGKNYFTCFGAESLFLSTVQCHDGTLTFANTVSGPRVCSADCHRFDGGI